MRRPLVHVLPWLSNVVVLVLPGCSDLSSDCRATGTCPRPVPVAPYCDGVWRFTTEDGTVCQDAEGCSPNGICEDCPERDEEGVWRFPNGEVAATPDPQDVLCPEWLQPEIGGARGVGGAGGVGDARGTSGAGDARGTSGAGGAGGARDAGGAGNARSAAGAGGAGGAGDAAQADAPAGQAGAPRGSSLGGQAGGGQGGEPAVRGGSGGVPPEAGAAGDVASDLCNGACGGATPVCSERSECVQCTQNLHCEAAEPLCDTSRGVCVACLDHEHCTVAEPLCDTSRGVCVSCLDHEDCPAAEPLCDTTLGECVACLANDDCGQVELSRCVEGSCQGCATHDDCAHLVGTTACDEPSQMCVECTIDTESQTCGSSSCDPATHTCTETLRGSVGLCRPCLSDSECTGGDQDDPDTRCVPLTYAGVPRPGGYCLRRAAKDCGRPYMVPVEAQSLSGAGAELYCGIDEDSVTCEAVLDLVGSQTCVGGDDAACGCVRDTTGACIGPGEGGLCRDFTLAADQCTYACGTDNHCPAGVTCAGPPDGYCIQ